MIDFEKFTLDNGLRIIVHKDTSTPIVAINILYDVGARDEDPQRTGFAHLFEHLMFGGSLNIPKYDEPCSRWEARTMPLPIAILPIIILHCQSKTSKLLSG